MDMFWQWDKKAGREKGQRRVERREKGLRRVEGEPAAQSLGVNCGGSLFPMRPAQMKEILRRMTQALSVHGLHALR